MFSFFYPQFFRLFYHVSRLLYFLCIPVPCLLLTHVLLGGVWGTQTGSYMQIKQKGNGADKRRKKVYESRKGIWQIHWHGIHVHPKCPGEIRAAQERTSLMQSALNSGLWQLECRTTWRLVSLLVKFKYVTVLIRFEFTWFAFI